jgi:4,5-DOPA dioxygenase extradiol
MTASDRSPVLFIGHGSPENAIEDNQFSRGWRQLASEIPRPEAILCVSAHWLTSGTGVTAMPKPKTIHDFYGFPPELYDARYEAPGSPELAAKIKQMVKAVPVVEDSEWGLDHGTWIVLANMFPEADIPVIQLSIDMDLPAQTHFSIGRELAGLRQDNVLIIGSGNLVHNLMRLRFDGRVFDWAVEFDAFVTHALAAGDNQALVDFERHPTAAQAHPTTDHYLPLLYAIGAAGEELPRFINEGIFAGSVSMRCAVFGA